MRAALFLVLATLTTGAAVASEAPAPLKLSILTKDLSLTIGGELRVEAVLSNSGSADLRLEKGAALRYLVLCRTAGTAPGQWGLGTGSPIVGGAYGGGPSDPQECRENPPETSVLRAGERLPLATVVKVPARCVEGQASLKLSFASVPEVGRDCPGIWHGELGGPPRQVPIHHRITGKRTPTGSPADLRCTLSAAAEEPGPRFRLTLENSTANAWRARAIPSVELAFQSDPQTIDWAPLRLADPPSPLPADQAESLDLPPHGTLSRTLDLSALSWGDDFSGWPAAPLSTLPEGSYQATVRMEILGGKSWEFVCETMSLDLHAP
ncbi:MAG TPA: hypothetical protein VGS22_10310 [Thermoanaerobaculia bacterium]|nr:hypothetical protein [Thermoanaerobaculia bacterium]